MYRPRSFREDRIDVLHNLVRTHPFATLVVLSQEGLIANHQPFVLHEELSENGTLRGHVARANPLWKTFNPNIEALAIFHGPESYITPSWYPSKKEHGKVVPTWNYAVVHSYGSLRPVEDAAWLRAHLDTLTFQQENQRPVPWKVADAPEEYVKGQLRGIVGLELPISRIEGKWKVSQNRNEQDRRGVSRGLQQERSENSSDMADLVDQYGGRG